MNRDMHIGSNMFGLGRWLTDDFRADVRKLKGLGLTSLEINIQLLTERPLESAESLPAPVQRNYRMRTRCIWDLSTAAENIRIIRDAGMEVISAHIFWIQSAEELRRGIPALTAFLRDNHLRYLVLSCYHMEAPALEAYYPVMRALSDALAAAGGRFLYHNHDSELWEDGSGGRLLDRILAKAPGMGLELDVGWAEYGGLPAAEAVQRYADRMQLLHFKDYRPDKKQSDGRSFFCPIGEGVISPGKVLEVCPPVIREPEHVIIDIDDTDGDFYEDLAVSIRNIKDAGIS